MNKEYLYKLLDKDAAPTPSDVSRLRELVGTYPYFEVGRFLYLKALYEHDTPSFELELTKQSALLGNREALFYYIFRKDFAQYFKKTGHKDLSADQTKLLLNAFFDTHDVGASALEYESVNANLASVDYISYLQEEKNKIVRKERRKAQLNIDNLIYIEEKDNAEKKAAEENDINTSDDWQSKKTVKIVPVLGEYTMESIAQETSIPLKHQSIIDSFLEKSEDQKFSLLLDKEKLKGDKDYLEEEVKSDSELEEDTFFTETLAKIYTKQGRYEKAYEIIEHLSLKYPKKNSYFADQLSYLEKLIINKKYINKK